MADFDDLDGDFEALESTMDGARAMTQAFTSEIARAQVSLASINTDVSTLEKGLSTGLKRAFDGVLFKGMELSEAMNALAQSLITTAYNAAIAPVTDGFAGAVANGIGGLLGSNTFADGGAFTQGRVMPFAKGGVISHATAFPMRGGTGLMGEAGPEAIMPLARSADGSLGVRAGGGSPNNVTINISTPDVQGFQRSQAQIAASVNRALARGQRNA